MNDLTIHLAETAAAGLEIFGIAIIILFVIVSTLYTLYRLLRQDTDRLFEDYRQQVGRGILLGLELLVAADIILTVAIDLNLTSVGILAGIVLIRTFLSFTLEAEIHGRWPWQEKPPAKNSTAGNSGKAIK